MDDLQMDDLQMDDGMTQVGHRKRLLRLAAALVPAE